MQFEKAMVFMFFCKKAKVFDNFQPDKNLEKHCFPEDNLALLELLCFLSFQHMRATDKLSKELKFLPETTEFHGYSGPVRSRCTVCVAAHSAWCGCFASITGTSANAY